MRFLPSFEDDEGVNPVVEDDEDEDTTEFDSETISLTSRIKDEKSDELDIFLLFVETAITL